MKQLIALGNGCLCPAAQGNILEVWPTDPGLHKHIQAITQIPGRSAFPAPLLIVLLFPNTYFICLFHQPSVLKVLNAVCSGWQQRCRGLLLAQHPREQEVALPPSQRIPAVLGHSPAAPRCPRLEALALPSLICTSLSKFATC